MQEKCFFCEEHRRSRLAVPNIGIAFGMAGDDYSFCKKCLKEMTAMDFWRKLSKSKGFVWPLRRTSK